MVNKTFLPTPCYQAKRLTPLRIDGFRLGTAFAQIIANRGLGEPGGSPRSANGLGGLDAHRRRGEPPMENMLLVGLSRQMVLERQMDVVANNVANVNTNGYKADKSLFAEYLKTGAHEDNFVGRDRAVSYVLDSGTFKDFAQGPSEQTKNPLDVAIDGGGFLVVQTRGGERYTRDGGLQINNQGQLVTAAGDPVLGTSGPIVFQPTDHDINIAAAGNVTVVEGVGHTDSVRGKLRLVGFAQAQRLLKEGSKPY